MQRSIQLQLLTFLAALGALGAALHPTFDTILFAVAFVFGTLLMQVRVRLEPVDRAARDSSMSAAGKVIGALLPWGLAAARSTMGSLLPAKLTASVIIAAAVVPTGVLVADAIRAVRIARRERQPD